LSIQSQTLSGANAGNAVFAANADQTDPTGAFLLQLPPGTYGVRMFPAADDGFSITDSQINVPSTSSCDCGIPLKLNPTATLSGSVASPAGPELVSPTRGTAPSATAAVPSLASMPSPGPLHPRAEPTMTAAPGLFFPPADLGLVDLTVQPDPSSNLPWLV